MVGGVRVGVTCEVTMEVREGGYMGASVVWCGVCVCVFATAEGT